MLLMASFKALPAWKKVLVVLSTLFIWPWMLFIAALTGVSMLPFLMFGRWEGDLGKRPIIGATAEALKRAHVRTERYYAHDTTTRSPPPLHGGPAHAPS